MKTFYWSFVLMLLPSMAYTQTTEKENEFSMSMQIRPRAEYRNGALVPRNEGQKAASFINNRARLSLDYKRSDLEIKMSAQHVGVWGQDPQIDKNGRFILNEAWAKLDFGKGFFAQLGRQTLVYDDERILGGLDWNVAGRYHDAPIRIMKYMLFWLSTRMMKKRQVVLITILLLVSLTRICRLCGITIKQIRFRSGLLYCL